MQCAWNSAGPTAPFPGDLQGATAILPSNAVPGPLASQPPGPLARVPQHLVRTLFPSSPHVHFRPTWPAGLAVGKMDTLIVSSLESLPGGSERWTVIAAEPQGDS